MKDIRPQHRSGTASVCRPSTAPPQTAAPGGQCGVCAHTDSHANRSLCPMTAQPTRYRRGPPHLSALNAAQGRRWGTEPSGRGFSLPTKLPALRTQSSPRGSNSPGAALHCIAPHLFGRGGHSLLHHNQRTRDVLLLHALAVHLDGFDAHFGLL